MILSFSARWTIGAIAATAGVLLATTPWLSQHGIAAVSSPSDVLIDNFTFGPGVLTIPRGTKVTWTNKDDDPHTVASVDDPKLFKSPALDTDETFAFTFSEAGTFKYFCTIHPRMQGTVVVQ
jgi:plastocyanin